MKNKKGFTLVELIAVIAILAVILLIVVPNIVDMFNNGKKDAFIRQVQSVWREAEKEFTANVATDQGRKFFCDSANTSLGCSTLALNRTEIKYLVTFDRYGTITAIGLSNNNFCYLTNTPDDMAISRDDLVEGGTLSCTDSSCSCGEGTQAVSYSPVTSPASGNGSSNSGSTVTPEPTPTNRVVYWNVYTANPEITNPEEMTSRFASDFYPTNAASSFDDLGISFVRTTLSPEDEILKQEICTQHMGEVFCLYEFYYSQSKEATAERLRDDLSQVYGEDDIECEFLSESAYDGVICTVRDRLSFEADSDGYTIVVDLLAYGNEIIFRGPLTGMDGEIIDANAL